MISKCPRCSSTDGFMWTDDYQRDSFFKRLGKTVIHVSNHDVDYYPDIIVYEILCLLGRQN